MRRFPGNLCPPSKFYQSETPDTAKNIVQEMRDYRKYRHQDLLSAWRLDRGLELGGECLLSGTRACHLRWSGVLLWFYFAHPKSMSSAFLHSAFYRAQVRLLWLWRHRHVCGVHRRTCPPRWMAVSSLMLRVPWQVAVVCLAMVR